MEIAILLLIMVGLVALSGPVAIIIALYAMGRINELEKRVKGK